MRETVNLIHTIIWREGLLWWLLLKFMKINTISFEVKKFGIYREGSNYWFTHRQRSELFGNRSSEISKIVIYQLDLVKYTNKKLLYVADKETIFNQSDLEKTTLSSNQILHIQPTRKRL